MTNLLVKQMSYKKNVA